MPDSRCHWLVALLLLLARSDAFLHTRSPSFRKHTFQYSSTTQSPVQLEHVEFADAENSSATPVILLHGLLGSKRNFATVAASLSAQLRTKRRIIGLDLRNHGENHHDWRDTMDYTSMAADVIQFCTSQGLDKVILVGHSMGGKVSQAVALLEPDIVESLCVIDIAPVAYTTTEHAHWKAVADIIHVLKSVPVDSSTQKKTLDAALRESIPDPALRAFCLTNFDFTAGCWKIHLEGIWDQLDDLAGFDLGGSYVGDTFFIQGQQSKFVRAAYIPVIQELFPNHMLTTVKGAGHWVHAEQPEATVALLKRFLDR